MRYFLALILKFYLFISTVIGFIILTLFCLWATALLITWVALYNDKIIFPNGMIIKRELSFTSERFVYGRNALYTSDGKSELVSSVKSVCFDDRYINVTSYKGRSGTFDGLTNSRVDGSWLPARDIRATDEGAQQAHSNCKGYYKTYLSAATLYPKTSTLFDGKTRQHYPILCHWRNIDNPDLTHKDWLDYPCVWE